MPTYYPTWIATGGQNVVRRGPDCATPSEAAQVIKEKLAKGYASLGVVVRVEADGSRDVMGSYVWPPAARKVIGHYEQILDSLEE